MSWLATDELVEMAGWFRGWREAPDRVFYVEGRRLSSVRGFGPRLPCSMEPHPDARRERGGEVGAPGLRLRLRPLGFELGPAGVETVHQGACGLQCRVAGL